MPGFGVSFGSAAGALSAIQKALDTIQNNIVNANTPGYATERVNFSAKAFDVTQGLMGGIDVSLSSTRDQFLEQSVRTETSALGLLEQSNPLLSNLQNAFSATGDSGVPGALSTFANSFSALSATPNDVSARANAIEAASTVAQAFNQTAAHISQVAADATQQAASTVSQINALAAHIASLNATIQGGGRNDAGLAADLNHSLESLSELVNVSVTNQPDGSASALLDGQTPLVLGSTAYALAVKSQPADSYAPYPNGDSGIMLTDQNGADITGQATQGKLAGLLQVRNQAVPYYLGTESQVGELNNLAKSFALRVNTIITGAQTAAGATVTPLFTYNPSDDTKAASTLAVNAITTDQIVTADATSGNGVAAELADITNPTNPADLMSNGQSFTAFYGQLAGQTGGDAARAASDLQTQQSLTTQAQNQRTQTSGVSLNDQAAQLLSLQQAYQATARIITILNSLSQTAVNLIPQA
jgi:flagellar hook-associated protein 1 FlgK